MGIACIFGHMWDGCKCARCGAAREEAHAWKDCRCETCGTDRGIEHVFGSDCKCRVCEIERHSFGTNFQCTRCAKTLPLAAQISVLAQSMNLAGITTLLGRRVLEHKYVSEDEYLPGKTYGQGALEAMAKWRCILIGLTQDIQRAIAASSNAVDGFKASFEQLTAALKRDSFSELNRINNDTILERFAPWSAGKQIDLKQIQEIVSDLTFIVGPGLNVTRGQALRLLKDVEEMSIPNQVSVRQIENKIEETGEYDGVTLAFALLPYLADCTITFLAARFEAFHYDEVTELARLRRLLQD